MAIDLEAFYRRYAPMVLRRCRRLLRDEEKAVDAMHDVFVEVLRRQAQLTDAAPSSLLHRVATNVCLNRLRTERRSPVDRDEELLTRIACLDDLEARSAMRQLLDRIFRGDRESTRTMAVLHFVDGMTFEEVAAEVGLSVSGVRKRLRILKERIAAMEEVGHG